VIGLIPGSDPALREEALLIGGHLDHCGRAWELLPGANDDASAVAVTLGVAEAFFRSGRRPRRTIALAAFGGEELGFLGSEFYCAHPRIPLDRTTAMINMDLVGCGEGIFAYAGRNFPELWAFFEEANRAFVGRPLATCAVANLMRPRLDGMIFAARGVPVVSFALVGPEGTSPGSHTTRDTVESITPGPMADLSRLIFAAAAEMAGRDVLDFRTPGGPK
jgi:Zn-dependent M28 family amino/carboxypeptidase